MRDKATRVSGSLSIKNSIHQVTRFGFHPQRGVLMAFKQAKNKIRLVLLKNHLY